MAEESEVLPNRATKGATALVAGKTFILNINKRASDPTQRVAAREGVDDRLLNNLKSW